MRIHIQLICVVGLFFCACKKEETTKASNSSLAGSKSTETGLAGTLILQLEPKNGAAPETVAKAAVTVENHPEITAVASAGGKVEMSSLLPGTLNVYVTSADGTALTATTSKYGLKFDNVIVKAGQATDLGTQEFKETGGIKGVVDFFENPNNLDLTGSDIFIPGTSFIAKSDNQGRFTLMGLPEGKYSIRLQHTGFAVLDMKDVEVTEGHVTDLGSVTLSLSDGPEGSVQIAPEVTATINGASKKIAKSCTVTFNLNYDSDAALMKISDEPSFLNKSWTPVSKTKTWTYNSDGPKAIYVMYSDLNGLESSPFYDEVLVDTEAPVLTSVTLLNGWTQTSKLQVFADFVASDTGSGIAEVMFSNVDGNFTNGETWQPYAARKDWTLSAGDGAKVVYAKVKDYAGHVSVVKTDAINKSDYTIILNTSYLSKMTLYKAQSPYKMSTSITFDSDLEIEPGTTIAMEGSRNLKVKGVFTAAGTASQPITIVKEASATCSPEIELHDGLPGISENHRVSYVTFNGIKTIHINGGEFSYNTFDSSSCSGNRGFNVKTGEDNLYMHHNTFNDYLVGIQVNNGNGNTRFENNTGTLNKAVVQRDAGNGTIMRNNTLSWNGNIGGAFIEVENGALTMSNNTLGGANANIVKRASTSALTISGLTVTSCASFVDGSSGNGTALTVEDSIINNCGDVIGWAQDPVVFRHNTINYSISLMQTGAFGVDATFLRNNITCSSSVDYCDLARSNGGGALTITLTENNITCLDANHCRGGFVGETGGGSFGPFTLAFAGNHFTDKTPVANIASSLILDAMATESTTTDGNIRGYEFKGSQVGIPSTWNVSGEGTHSGAPVSGTGPR